MVDNQLIKAVQDKTKKYLLVKQKSSTIEQFGELNWNMYQNHQIDSFINMFLSVANQFKLAVNVAITILSFVQRIWLNFAMFSALIILI